MIFDPYHKWLGIAPKDQPPNHYRLLAIELFEADAEVIDAAANRQMAYLQQRATGEHVALSQKLLNEVAAARLCLLNPKKKAEYDAELRAKLAERGRATETPSPNPTSVASDWLSDVPPTPSVPLPVWHARGRRFFRLEPWHYAVAIGAASLLLIGIWAFLAVGRNSEQQATIDEPKELDVPQQGDVAAASMSESPSSQGSHPPPSTPASATTPPESPSSTADTEPPKSDSATHSLKAEPTEDAPAIYNVTVDPSWADLRADPEKATITGSGRDRQIRIDKPRNSGSPVHVVASCDGYESDNRWLTPVPGVKGILSISLERVAPSPTAASLETGQSPRPVAAAKVPRSGVVGKPIPRSAGNTRYDRATGRASFIYTFTDPAQANDFEIHDRSRVTVSGGWLRIGVTHITHKAHFRTVSVEVNVDVTEKGGVVWTDLVTVHPFGHAQLQPWCRRHLICGYGGKTSESVPVPNWDLKDIRATFRVQDNQMASSVNGQAVTWPGKPGNASESLRVLFQNSQGTVSYTNIKIEGKLDPVWASKAIPESQQRKGPKRTK